MNRKTSTVGLLMLLATFVPTTDRLDACTNLLVSSGASRDGSTYITYAVDNHDSYGELLITPARQHRPGAMREISDWDDGTFYGRIPQPEITYAVVGHINEHQVSIGETTFGGLKKLHGGPGKLDYGSLMFIALERSRSAREAITVMTSLVEEFGYVSKGESFSIADPNEVWILEMIGKGPDILGAVWVARKVPNGSISAHANYARIRQFPRNDPDTTVYSSDVISFAREMDLFDGKDEDFSFVDTYAPIEFGDLRFCESRVWSLFRRAAPSLDLPVESIMNLPGQPRLPLWITPDEKLDTARVFSLMRDHFEGTPLDMTKDVGAGPFACPYRWRPMTWKLGDDSYVHERAISTQQTAYSFIAQARAWLPNSVGGVLWLGFDDTYMTVYTPMYCGNNDAPPTFSAGVAALDTFSWDAAFWVFNWVSNQVYSRYSDMIIDLQQVQNELEGAFLARQHEIESAAVILHETSKPLARDYLTDYSVEQGEEVTRRWRRLGESLLVKYLDGNVKDETGKATHPRYPDSWYKRIVDERGDEIRAPSEDQ